MSKEEVFVHVAAYSSPQEARADFADLRSGRRLATEGHGFDAALVYKDEGGEIKVRKRERATGKGLRTGVGVGAVLGAVLPPTIPLSVAMNTTARGAVSYLRKGLSHDDIDALGDALMEGQAALIVLAETDLEDYIARSASRSLRQVSRELEIAMDELEEKLGDG